MQCGRFSGSGRSDTQNDAVGFFWYLLEHFEIPLWESHLVERQWFTRREDTHDHVFVVSGCGESCDTKFDLFRLRELEFDLSILRFTALGNVQAGHDLESGDDSSTVTLRDLHVLETVTVDSETNQGFTSFSVGLDVNVRCILAIGIGNDLVGQTDDCAVVFIQSCGRGVLHRLGLCFGDKFAENVGNIFVELASSAVALSGSRTQKLGDVATETDGEPNVEARKRPLDVLNAIKVTRIIGQNLDRRAISLERHPMVFFQVVDIEILQQFHIDEGAFAVLDIRTLIELCERPADIEFGDFVFFDQNAFQIAHPFSGVGNGLVEFVLSDPIGAD